LEASFGSQSDRIAQGVRYAGRLVASERGGFEFGMRPESFEPLIKRLERIANRIVLLRSGRD